MEGTSLLTAFGRAFRTPDLRKKLLFTFAIIAAAVAAAMEQSGEENTTGFVVRSIRRINNAPAWNRAGREEQVYSRM